MIPAAGGGGGGFSGSSAASNKTDYSGSNTFGGFNYKSDDSEGLDVTTIAVIGAAVVLGIFVLKKFG